tara:strand:- start:11001 stop:11633 length:633 start_codon:yes stop_codon:yes gene_type:complete
METKNEIIKLYKNYYEDRNFEQKGVFKAIFDKYSVSNVLYPGCFVHITPSFIFSEVVYVDNDGKANKFFSKKIWIAEMIKSRKQYDQEPNLEFISQDYNKALPYKNETFDLLISHYAGIISQPCKKYLKKGGLLLVNNSHADAGVAYLDEDYELIAAVLTNRKSLISEDKLGEFFIPKRDHKQTIETLIQSQKGIGYTKTANLYIFKKIK